MKLLILLFLIYKCISLTVSEKTDLKYNEKNDTSYDFVFRIVNSVFSFTQGNGISLTNHTQCERDLLYYYDSLKKSSVWALKMFDASTKFPRGLLAGHTTDLGNYDECLSVSAPSTGSTTTFLGQHCLAEFNISSSRMSDKISTQWPRCRQQEQLLDDPVEVTKFCVSLCIPSTCSAAQLQSILQRYLISDGLSTTVLVDEALCNVKSDPEVPPAQWLVIVLLAIFIALVVSSTVYEIVMKDSKNALFKSFSAVTNGQQLLSVKKSEDTIGPLLGMRFISMGWVILGTRYYWNGVNPSVNPLFVSDTYTNYGTMHIINNSLAGDTFLLISGLLVTYKFMHHMSNNTFSLLHFYLHRLIRITPAYFVVLMVQATFMDYSAYGPFWNYETAASKEGCHSYWWTNVLYINNYVHTSTQCLDQSWYLAVDCQLYLLSPIMLYMLWKWPKKYTYSMATILILAGIFGTFAIAYVNKIPVSALSTRENSDMLQYLYYPTHTRFTSWLIGIILGDILYKTHGKEVHLHVVWLLLGTIVSTALTIGLVIGMTPFQMADYEYSQVGDAMFYAFFRPGWAVGVAWIIFVCDAGFGALPNMLLSWHIFMPLSRLVYGMFLSHYSLFILREKSRKSETYVADSFSIPQFMGDMIFSMAIGAILAVVIEIPSLKIEQALRNRGEKTKSDKNGHSILDAISNTETMEEGSSLNGSNGSEMRNT